MFFDITNDFLDYAYDNGLTIVTTCGFGGVNFDEQPNLRPLNGWLDNVITATGIGPTGRPSANNDLQGNLTFQNPDPWTNTGSWIDIAGPGGDFTFTKPNDLVISTSSPIGIAPAGALYSTGGGTSVGTAHVVGVAAQVVAQQGPMKPRKLMRILYEGTIDLGPRGRDIEVGHGLTDVPRTLGLD